MQYDTTLKLLLKRSGQLTMQELFGAPVVKWVESQLPKVQNLRVDLLGETAGGGLVHLELQSTHDPDMALRMAEYKLGIFRLLRKFPRQILLYLGESRLRMPGELRDEGVRFQYQAVDIRSLNGKRLLASDALGDNVIAILARLRDHKEAVRKIVHRIAELPPIARQDALAQLLVLAGLRRRLVDVVRQEVREMPITLDIREHPFFGPEFKKAERKSRKAGLKEGRQKGLQKGRQEGEQKGELTILRRLIEKRFGPVPSWVEQRLAGRSTAELEEFGVRLLDARSLEDLLR